MPHDIPDPGDFLFTTPEFASLRRVGGDALAPEELDRVAGLQIQVNPETDWKGVDPVLRAAIARAAYELGCTLYVSAGREGRHARRSFHRLGKAVDISRVNGERLAEMQPARRLAVSRAVGIAIMRHLPPHRYAELYSPAFAVRLDKTLDAAHLREIHGKHADHIHISIR